MKSISTFFYRNEKWLTPAVLLGGFVLDNLTIRRSDLLVENIVMTAYFFLLLGSMLVWHKIESSRVKTVALLEFQSIIFLVTQFFFGGLFSALTVFYVKSASFFASWPFLLFLFGGMISVEYFKKHLTQFYVQIGTIYLLLFTYCILIVPLFARKISSPVFVLSGLISLVIITLYLFIFYKAVPSLIVHRKRYLVYILGGIFVLMNTFYFSNMIPPIPLALRDSGIYQNVTRGQTGYSFVNFANHFSFKTLRQEYIVPAGSPVFFYSSVFAPVKFEQRIVHQWQKKNIQGDWTTVSIVAFPIYGGNDSGYRGYTISHQVTKGEWRVLVKTQGGQVLGKKSFIVR